MKIACLQFSPQVGDVDNNLNRADAVLSRANPEDLDLLVLPELAFTGYNFKSLQQISPYLEHTASGITSLWARTTALKYECVVTVGYPEKVDVSERWPASPEYYNSAITVNADGETIANYRKTFLYYRDETWALEGPDGFYDGEIPGLGNVAMGICMDLNPYKFEAPWTAWEFAYHVLHKQANLVIISMAWMTQQDLSVYSRKSKEPDIDTLSYWVSRLEPIIRAEVEGEIIVVLANRCGTEDEAIYAGTSCVLGIHDGEVKVYGILGRGEKELLVVDTTNEPQFKLVAEPNAAIPEDTMQSRNAPAVLDPEAVLAQQPSPPPPEPSTVRKDTRADTPFPSDTRLQGREALVASIDAVLSSEITAVSPVDSTTVHAFFGSERLSSSQRLAKVRSSIPSIESLSSATSISSFFPSPVPILKDPTPPRAGTPRSGTTNHRDKAAERRSERRGEGRSTRPSDHSSDRPTVPPKQTLGMIEIPPTTNWDREYDDQPPDSASSMKVNTPWESSPALFRAEEIIKIMKAPTPSPPIQSSTPIPSTVPQKARSGSGSSKASIPAIPIACSTKQAPIVPILSSSNAAPIVSSSKHASPPGAPTFVPPTERPQSPKSRNTSRTRTPHREPALATQHLINEPAIAPIINPFEDIERPISRRQGATDLPSQFPPNGGLAPRIELGMSPRPSSTGW